MTKLTLSMEEAVVEKAKSHAAANGMSVSAMFTQFVKSLDAGKNRPLRIGPLTRKLTGILQLPPGKDYRDVLTDALEEKYGIRK